MPVPLTTLKTIDPKRICLIKPSSLGDIVHALPVLTALRVRWPHAHIAWVVNKGLRSLVEGHPDLNEVIPFDRGQINLRPRGLANMARFLASLRREKFDLTIDLQGLFRSGLMSFATGAKYRLGLKESREGSTKFYTHAIPTGGPNEHAVDRMLKTIEALGVDISAPCFKPVMSDGDRQWARETIGHLPGPKIVLNVGARWLTKRWPPRHFAEVARRAASERGASLIAVGAPEDRELVDELIAAISPLPVLDLCAKTTLPQLAALAAECDLFVSNDTGPLHLAAATGTKVIGIFTCTNPKKTGPYGPNAITVQSCVWCAPSYVRKCDRLECMTELTPDRAWPAIVHQLGASLQA
jgi:lipopolysaccharide heptosyltransferase I